MNQCRGCHTRVDPFFNRKFADISFELGEYSSAVLGMYLSLAQEDPENNGFYYQRVSRIDSALGNEEEARRFQSFAQQVKCGKG
jgi:hypothetical protein